jgi:hypothetical protein
MAKPSWWQGIVGKDYADEDEYGMPKVEYVHERNLQDYANDIKLAQSALLNKHAETRAAEEHLHKCCQIFSEKCAALDLPLEVVEAKWPRMKYEFVDGDDQCP